MEHAANRVSLLGEASQRFVARIWPCSVRTRVVGTINALEECLKKNDAGKEQVLASMAWVQP